MLKIQEQLSKISIFKIYLQLINFYFLFFENRICNEKKPIEFFLYNLQPNTIQCNFFKFFLTRKFNYFWFI